jgi:hypothetical protein
LVAQNTGAGSAPVDTAALTPAYAWSVGGIRATAEDVADFYRGGSSPESCFPRHRFRR